MEWITSLLEGENGSAIQLVLITAGLALALIVLFWLFRRIAGTPARRAAKNRVPRLSITDFKDIGDKRHLILARRDNVEHLILIGGPNDVIIETGIVRTKSGQTTERPGKTASKVKTAKAEADAKASEEKSEGLVPEMGTAAIAGVATVAGTTIAATETAAESVSTATQNVSEAVMEAVEPVVNTVTETSSEALETVSEAISDVVEPDPEIDVVETVEIAEPEADTTASVETDDIEISFDESDLEATLSDALTNEPLIDNLATNTNAADTAPEIATAIEADAKQTISPDDEMQKLLAELASETKEPA